MRPDAALIRYHRQLDEVAFFTSGTHPPLPLFAAIRDWIARLAMTEVTRILNAITVFHQYA